MFKSIEESKRLNEKRVFFFFRIRLLWNNFLNKFRKKTIDGFVEQIKS